MSNLPNIPIEPLSDLSWRRIEQRVFEELDQLPRHERARQPEPAPRRMPWWRPALALGAAAAVAAALLLMMRGGSDEPAWQRIVTGASPVEITLDRATLAVNRASSLWVRTGGAEGVEVRLEEGGVDCSVSPAAHRPPFVVEAGDVRVEVMGTRFLVEREEGATRVEVIHGTVQVLHDNGEREVLKTGQRWPRVARSAAAPEAGHGSQSAAGPERAEPAAQAQALYEKAARLEASNPGAAADIYRELARAQGPWAAIALFAHGRLEMERGHHEAALQLLETYLRRYPDGPNAMDARELIEPTSR